MSTIFSGNFSMIPCSINNSTIEKLQEPHTCLQFKQFFAELARLQGNYAWGCLLNCRFAPLIQNNIHMGRCH